MRTIKDFEIQPEVETLLKGETNEIREYLITLGQSDASKGVLFVLYAYLKNCNSPYVNPMIYLGNLGIDINTAVINARKRIPKYELYIMDSETVQDRRHNSTMPFGKYKGMTIEEIFDKDEKYIFWLSNSDSLKYIKSKTLLESLHQYAEIAKENIIISNQDKTKPELPVEEKKSEKVLKLYYRNYLGRNDFGGFDEEFRFTDILDNRYSYRGSSNKFNKLSIGDEITISCRIIGSFTGLGLVFNKLSLK